MWAGVGGMEKRVGASVADGEGWARTEWRWDARVEGLDGIMADAGGERGSRRVARSTRHDGDERDWTRGALGMSSVQAILLICFQRGMWLTLEDRNNGIRNGQSGWDGE